MNDSFDPVPALLNAIEQARQRLQEHDADLLGAMCRVLDASIAHLCFRALKRFYKTCVFGFLIAGRVVALLSVGLWARLFPSSVNFSGPGVENAALPGGIS